jgi:uncharacterized protein (DUF1697 family)
MPLVAFMRGVNVGGRKTFRPAALAAELAALEVVNIGAAGTFVVRKKVSAAALRKEILGRLPFEPGLMICTGREILDLAASDGYSIDEPKGTRAFVTVLGSRPGKAPKLPLIQPPGSAWQVKVHAVVGRFALSLWKRTEGTMLYPNEVVEKQMGMPATTRNRDTIEKIRATLEAR